MNTLRIPIAVLAILAVVSGAAQAQSSHDERANLPFPYAYPTKESAHGLHDELTFQRAVQAYFWSSAGPEHLCDARGSPPAD